MDKHALKVLEFDKIKDQLKEHITSELTEKFIDDLEPKGDINYIKDRQEEVSQAKMILTRKERPPFGAIYDIRSSLSRAQKGMVLREEELLNILKTLITGHRLNSFFLNIDDQDNNFYRIIELARSITLFKDLERSIKGAIDQQGRVKDSASPKLRDIRRNMRRLSDGIKDKLKSIINSRRYQKYIQESVVTIRDDRYVVPIKAEYGSNFPGIVHDQSSSGQTLFIEPMPIVKMNNNLRRLVSEEEAEIYRILKELSSKVMKKVDQIKGTVQILAILDFIFAKAKYSIEINASEPLLDQEGKTKLIKARHPLLDGDVVPTDISLGEEFSTLVITGPNTGGKTVTLKTVGLLTLMGQSGLHIPALSGSKLGIYKDVYSDIGDEQSIEQSLSTFSSHMTQIIKIVKKANEGSLILLDELGAGTDPAEGAALAMALLDHLHNKGSKTIATTHYSELKTYAYGKKGVENASVEFDVKSLQPTYRLQMGLPGRSNAFEISRRLGLREDIIDKAKGLLTDDDIELDKVIREIEKDKQEYSNKKEEAKESSRELKRLKEEYNEKLKDFEQKKERELSEAYREANKIVKRAQKRAENIIKDLKEKKKLSDKEIEEARRSLREERKDILGDKEDLIEESMSKKKAPKLKIGDKVKIKSLNKKGEVLDLFEDKGEGLIQAGIMKVNIDLRDLEKIDGGYEEEYQKTNISKIKGAKIRNISSKLDLRGMRVLEAKHKLEKYLDDASLANLNQLEIVHGKGTGKVRKMVHQVLDKHRGIREYRLGRPREGGMGVTIVNL
ncbi:endonuclease MutS2 [Halonatronum saccharophilum]|uniref:endonuclease MutS2 n=1 Tax=Halonatronum saccharophilum TaxID=150060 RepID=UPI000488350C|nr:endonuclease MutS2 [Halonatronum saccharophilum]